MHRRVFIDYPVRQKYIAAMTMRRHELILTILFLVGAVLLGHSTWRRIRLEPEFERLKRLTGELVPYDPTKGYVSALPSEEPLDFAWRLYLPAECRIYTRHGDGWGASGGLYDEMNTVIRLRFREVDGQWQFYQQTGTTQKSNVEPRLADILSRGSHRLRVEQLGQEAVEELDMTKETSLLRITLPDDLEAEYKSRLTDRELRRFSPAIWEVKVGPPNAWP